MLRPYTPSDRLPGALEKAPGALFAGYSLFEIPDYPGYLVGRFESGRYGGDTFLLFLDIEGILFEIPDTPLPLSFFLPAFFGDGLTEKDLSTLSGMTGLYRTEEEVAALAPILDRIFERYA